MADALSWLRQMLGGGQDVEPTPTDALGQLQSRLTPQQGLWRYLATSGEALSDLPGGVDRAVGDIGQMLYGLAQRQGMAEAGLPPAPESELAPLRRGASALGGLSDFLTGGYTSGLHIPGAGLAAREVAAAVPGALADESGALRIGLTPRALREQSITLDRPIEAAPDLLPGEYPTAAGHNLGPRVYPELTPAEPVVREPQVAPRIPASRAPTFGEQLRAEHLAGADPLPLAGAAMKVTPPEHVTNDEQMNAAVQKYVDYAMAGQGGRNWYDQSGQAILEHAGSPEVATGLAAGLARTSPQTDVASNLTHAVTLHNQYMAGDPLYAGRFPNVMGADMEDIYRRGDPVTGEKIGPFMGAVARQWAPDLFPHNFVNDIWNMRGLEYPGPSGAVYTGSPTLGQHNYARIVADRARQRLEEITGQLWSPEQTQAAGWTGIRGAINQMTPGEAAFNFNDALRRNYAQASWESAPGASSGHFPEYHSAPWDVKQQYHDAIQGVLTDENGRDIIHSHLGLLTGRTFQAPGYFEGNVSPGSQSPVAVGAAPGGALQGVDPASRELLNTGELVRGLVRNQDAVAWNKPLWAGNVPVSKRDLFDVSLGRPLTPQETTDIAKAMHQETGTDFHSPIGTANGFRFINVPEVSGLPNVDFVAAAHKVLGRSDILPNIEGVRARQAASDSFYEPNDWKESPNGEVYRRGLGAIRSPDLQRRAAELLATLGPRLDAVDQQFAKTHGWTYGPQRRFWEEPAYQAFRLDTIPNTPRPGELRSTAQIGPNWRPLFGPGSLLGSLGAAGAFGFSDPAQAQQSGGLLGP